jgi:hypothetical protein
MSNQISLTLCEYIVKCSDSEAEYYVILFLLSEAVSMQKGYKWTSYLFSDQPIVSVFSPHTYPESKSQMFYPDLVQRPNTIKFMYMMCRCLYKWITCYV